MIIYTCQLLPINHAPNNTDQPTLRLTRSRDKVNVQTRRREPVT